MTWTPSTSLAGKVAIVIGASGGIGAATARLLARAGVRVGLGYRGNAASVEGLAAELPEALYGRHLPIQIDVEKSETIERMAELVAFEFGRADILVNAAGTTRQVDHGDLDGLDDALIDQVFASNWRGPFATIRALRPLLAANGDGLIVNVSSIAATTAIGSNVAYCGAKAGIDAMTQSLARALAPEIRVIAVSPGGVATGFVPGRDRSWIEEAAVKSPLRKVVEPEHVAGAIIACATHLPLTTGSILQIDGGRHL